MRKVLCLTGTLFLVLAGLVALPTVQPDSVLAGDATVVPCEDEEAFDDALEIVQSTGGGMLTVQCEGTIEFTSPKVITTDVTIYGPGVAFVGDGNTRLFTIEAGASLTVIRTSMVDGNSENGGAINNAGTLNLVGTFFGSNRAPGSSGGAIYNTGSLTADVINAGGNSADNGGAIFNASGASATILSSTFFENSASETVSIGAGGAIQNAGTLTIEDSIFYNGSANVNGGAINNISGATATIVGSTFESNSVPGVGGGIFSEGMLSVASSTFHQQTADTSGGAIAVAGGVATIVSVTFSENSSGDGHSIHVGGSGTATVTASILSSSATGDECGGTVLSGGSNVVDDNSCNFAGTNDLESSLTINLASGIDDNGGMTPTILLETGSSALDSAICAVASTTDQRGAPRPAVNCDKGALEVGAQVPVVIRAFESMTGPADIGEDMIMGSFATGPDNENLTFWFDCDNDGTYETEGTLFPDTTQSAMAACVFTEGGYHTVGLQVCDGPPGPGALCDTDTTEVKVYYEAVVLCASRHTGALSAARADDSCPRGTSPIEIESNDPTSSITICISRHTGALSYAADGECDDNQRTHVVPADGPLEYCVSRHTRSLSHNSSGTCAPNERPGIIPGDF